MKMQEKKQGESKSSLWPLTIWPEVGAAAEAVGKEAEPVNRLIEKYRTPLRIHLLKRFRHAPTILKNSDDLLQEFALAKILKEDWLKKSLSRRIRFRAFLRKSLENFVLDWWRKQPEYIEWQIENRREEDRDVADSEVDFGAESQKRNQREEDWDVADSDVDPRAGRTIPSTYDPPAPDSGTAPFDLALEKTICQDALKRMEEDCKDPQKNQPRRGHIWELFQLRLLGPILDDAKPIPYADLVQRFQLRSVTEATNMLLTAKRMFITHLRAVVADKMKAAAGAIEHEEIERAITGLLGKENKGLTFSVGDILDLPSLAAKLKQPVGSGCVSSYLAARLSRNTKNLLDSYSGGANRALQQALVNDLNVIISGGPIYEPTHFQDVPLRKQTQKLLDRNPQGGEFVSLNRLLLEDAYPLELSRKRNR
jgi:DNA-directed RNA polymerase specialized sigma24 family protein